MIKVSVVASRLDTMSARDMIEALIAGERDPRRLAELARGKMRAKRAELITALDGRFDDHHGELARLLLAQIDALSAQINTLTSRIEDLIAEMPEAAAAAAAADDGGGGGGGEDADITAPGTGDGIRRRAAPSSGGARTDRRGTGSDRSGRRGRLRAAQRHRAPRRDHRRRRTQRAGDHRRDWAGHEPLPTPGHLVGWAKLCPRTIQSGPVTRGGRTGKGNPYLKGALGQAAAAAARTDTFLGQRYRRIVKRRGKLKALVAVARSILVILKVTGEDDVPVDIKHRPPWNGRLPMRAMYMGNIMPVLPDSAGAIGTRLLPINTTASFAGREDRGLEDALTQELPGILELGAGGETRAPTQRVRCTGIPGAALLEDIDTYSNLIRQFLRDCCILENGQKVECTELFITSTGGSRVTRSRPTATAGGSAGS